MHRKIKAFTIIELLIVAAIIGVLAVVIVLNYASAKQKARDSRRVSDLDSIKSALEMFREANGRYPKQQSEDSLSAGYMCNSRWCTTGLCDDSATTNQYTRPINTSQLWIGGLVCNESGTVSNVCQAKADYMSSLPLDPKNPTTGSSLSCSAITGPLFFYAYHITADALGYKLYARMENNTALMTNDGGLSNNVYEVFNAYGQSLPSGPN